MANTKGNEEFKSDVFCMLLEDKKRALEVYNAMNHTAYGNPELVEMVPLENKGLSLSIRNDASFILDADLSLYEHQSTFCPNMPLRDLIYFANIIHDRIKEKNIYGRALVKIPVPHFVVFYNGKEKSPEHYELRLSDAFEKKMDEPEIELICQVYNINKGNNTDLMERCPTLRDYMYFVDLVREKHEKNHYSNLGNAIEQAIDQCIRENVLRDFLIENRERVTKMMQLDYTFERQIELERKAAEEARRQGEEIARKQGEKNGMQKKMHDLIRKKLLKGKTVEQIADELEEKADTIQPMYEQIRREMEKSKDQT